MPLDYINRLAATVSPKSMNDAKSATSCKRTGVQLRIGALRAPREGALTAPLRNWTPVRLHDVADFASFVDLGETGHIDSANAWCVCVHEKLI